MAERLFAITNPVRDYAWGSMTSIPEIIGTEPTGSPQAEMWIGSHPGAPSVRDADGVGLDELLEREPNLAGGTGLPFLMKLLAAATPLSLQVHPSRPQAETGFDREDAAGIPVDAAERSYRDRNPKPEMILAITPFSVLCGFRRPGEVADDLAELLGDAGDSGVGAELLAALRLPDEGDALRAAFGLIMSDRPDLTALVDAVVAGSAEGTSAAADTVRIVGAEYPGDPGVLGAAMLNRVDLDPGEGLYLDAGNVHAYLAGTGIEAMAPSDNVLRGGLTPKHIDVPGLLDIVRFEPITPHRVPAERQGSDGLTITSYWPPVADFAVHVVDGAGGSADWDWLSGPATVLVTAGTIELRTAAETLQVGRGGSAFLAAGESLSIGVLEGPVTAYLTTRGKQAGQKLDEHGMPAMVAPPRGRDEFGETPRPPLDPGTALAIKVTGSGVMRPEDVPANRHAPQRETADTIAELFPDAERTEWTIPGYQDEPMPVSTWRRRGATEAGPGFVWIHGGGMVSGDRYGGLGGPINWMLRYGGTVVSMEYRMPPDVHAPVLSEDCYAALAWAFEQADELGIDPTRVVIGGGSAGGGLAAATMLLARDRGLPPLFGAMLICPMLDDRNITTSSRQIERLSGWNGASNVVCWDAVLGDRRGTDDVSPYDAPARATWLGNLPPVHIDVGSIDPFRDEDVAFASAIWRDGGDCELLVVPGGWHGHDWVTSEMHIARIVRESRELWIDKLFKPVDVSGLEPLVRERLGEPEA